MFEASGGGRWTLREQQRAASYGIEEPGRSFRGKFVISEILSAVALVKVKHPTKLTTSSRGESHHQVKPERLKSSLWLYCRRKDMEA